MDSYWSGFVPKLYRQEDSSSDEDELVKLEQFKGPKGSMDAWGGATYENNPECIAYLSFCEQVFNIKSYHELKQLISETNDLSEMKFNLLFKNTFWGHISEKSCLETWLDIENEYYLLLKSHLKSEKRNEPVKKLNAEFCQVKNLLEEYLTEVCQQEVTKIDSIERAFEASIDPDHVARSKWKLFIESISREMNKIDRTGQLADKLNEYLDLPFERKEDALRAFFLQNIKATDYNGYLRPHQTVFLNFNYTDTAKKLYFRTMGSVNGVCVNIHGQLNNKKNPILFGYGDELDEDYRKIEQTNDNDFLENIKSIHYHNTSNYRRLLEFLQDEPYQVFVMGHSCGNSDRTLLNTIFEHENCISIKPFFYQWKDERTGEVKDNYIEISKNISRNFNDKQNLRDIVVNKEFCKSLIPAKP